MQLSLTMLVAHDMVVPVTIQLGLTMPHSGPLCESRRDGMVRDPGVLLLLLLLLRARTLLHPRVRGICRSLSHTWV